jgi:glycosyltransferase involved in cell wall biosynthesis
MVRELGIGGCERDLTKLALGLDRSLFLPHVGCFRDQGMRAAELREAGIPIVRFPVTSFRSPSFLKGVLAFRRYTSEHGIRLLHTFDAPTNVFGIAAARLTGMRPALASQLWFLETIQRQLWALHRLSLRYADAVVVNSHAVEKQLLEREGFAARHIHVSHNGVETEVFTPRSQGAAAENGVVIGAVCALRAEKRLDVLIDAFAQVRRQYPASRLLIVGSGEMLPALEQQTARLGLGESCTFEPAQSDVAPWLRRLDVFVMCSESESFPNSLLEAMACGCCVIGSDVGGIPELIESGRSGLLFRSGDAHDLAARLFDVLEGQVFRLSLAAQAARRAREHFSMQQAVARMGQLYSSLIVDVEGRRAS